MANISIHNIYSNQALQITICPSIHYLISPIHLIYTHWSFWICWHREGSKYSLNRRGRLCRTTARTRKVNVWKGLWISYIKEKNKQTTICAVVGADAGAALNQIKSILTLSRKKWGHLQFWKRIQKTCFQQISFKMIHFVMAVNKIRVNICLSSLAWVDNVEDFKLAVTWGPVLAFED